LKSKQVTIETKETEKSFEDVDMIRWRSSSKEDGYVLVKINNTAQKQAGKSN
jgi:hypothetical protein